MTFSLPLALILLVPLAGAGFVAASARLGWAARLPGMWAHVVAAQLQPHIARHSGLTLAGAPWLCLGIAAMLVVALSRPSTSSGDAQGYANLAGRVVVIDVGENLARHQIFMDALFDASTVVPTALVAVSGDAYRIVPFTTDKAQIDRYVRVLNVGMMPEPGYRPHLGLARAERILERAGYLVRQIVIVSGTAPPERIVDVPETEATRIIVPLEHAGQWAGWAESWGATIIAKDEPEKIANRLDEAARRTAASELPQSRIDLSIIFLMLAGGLWLLLFRRRAS